MSNQDPQPIAKVVAANLRLLRAKAGMTQRQLAAELDTNEMSISRWERGKHVPANWMLCRMAVVFGVDYAEFFDEHREAA